MRYGIGSGVLVVVLMAIAIATAGAATPSYWTANRAARAITEDPPRGWERHGWNVVMVNCDGLPARRGSPRSTRFGSFSCEITLVAPASTCPSTGDYVCVAGYDAFVLARTLRALGAERYALSRIP